MNRKSVEDTRLRRSWIRSALAAAAVLVAAGLATGIAPPATAQTFVPTADPDHPKVMYADSLISLNDRCVVRGGTLNPNYLPVYVNGRPVGFC
jgi:hypothetical protein